MNKSRLDKNMNDSYDTEIQRYLKFAVFFLGILAVDQSLGLIQDAQSILIPFTLAVFLVILLKPVMNFLEKHHWPRFFSVILSLIITLVITAVFTYVLDESIETLVAGFSERFGIESGSYIFVFTFSAIGS